MDNELEPVVGNWYTYADDGRTFVVLAVDEDKSVVEIRYEDGELEEIEVNDWPELELEPAEPPEGWEEALSEDPDAAGPLGLEEGEDGWRGSRRQAGKSWEDEDDEDEDEEDYDDWGEEPEDY